jgi:beta-mannanase
MNGPWETDWMGPTATEQRQWAEFFDRIVTTMRSVPGAHFLFDWNVNASYEDVSLEKYYPGNADVDIIGIDAYDESAIPLPPVGSSTRWRTLADEPLGLDAVYAFAIAHDKPLSIPEWGTLQPHSGYTYGDDGNYVAHIGQFVATHDVAYQAWYDSGDNYIDTLSPTWPAALAAYNTAFGPGSLVEREHLVFARSRR